MPELKERHRKIKPESKLIEYQAVTSSGPLGFSLELPIFLEHGLKGKSTAPHHQIQNAATGLILKCPVVVAVKRTVEQESVKLLCLPFPGGCRSMAYAIYRNDIMAPNGIRFLDDWTKDNYSGAIGEHKPKD